MKGVTLVELLVVALIIAILAGLSVPAFRKTFEGLQLSAAANDAASALRYAQERAIALRERFRFNLDEASGKYWMEKAAVIEGVERYEKISGKFGKTFYLPHSIGVESEQSQVIFNPDGSAEPIKIYLRDKKGNCFTIASEGISGYVKVYDYEK